jgi:hypothetical protein
MAPSGEHRRVTIRVETEVELDVALMAKTFAHMNSGDQARFFALAHQQMATYSREEPDGSRFKMGSYGRETQMLSIKDHFTQQPDAREFILSLYQMTIEEDTFTLEDIRKAKAAMSTIGELDFQRQYLDSIGCNPDELPGGFNERLARTERYVQQAAMNIPLHSSSASIMSNGEIVCHCVQPIGAWYNIGDRVLVHRCHLDEDHWGTVVKVRLDGRPDVQLDTRLDRSPPMPNDGPAVEGVVVPIPCDECKGTGKWTNPFNDETTPCSRGCKP